MTLVQREKALDRGNDSRLLLPQLCYGLSKKLGPDRVKTSTEILG